MTDGLQHNWSEPKAPARVVVLGCRGFVGSAIVAELKAHKIPCLGISAAELDLLSPDAAKALAARLQPDDALVVVSALTPDRGKDIATFMKNQHMMEAVCAALAEKAGGAGREHRLGRGLSRRCQPDRRERRPRRRAVTTA